MRCRVASGGLTAIVTTIARNPGSFQERKMVPITARNHKHRDFIFSSSDGSLQGPSTIVHMKLTNNNTYMMHEPNVGIPG